MPTLSGALRSTEGQKKAPSGTGWIHEIKHDGYRLMAHREGDGVRLLTPQNLLLACERWPGTPITLRQGGRVIEDSRRTRTAFWSNKGSREGGR